MEQKTNTPPTRRELAVAGLVQTRQYEEMVLRARNQEHIDLMEEVAIAQWYQENPEPGAGDAARELDRQLAQSLKQALVAFEINGFRYPDQP